MAVCQFIPSVCACVLACVRVCVCVRAYVVDTMSWNVMNCMSWNIKKISGQVHTRIANLSKHDYF